MTELPSIKTIVERAVGDEFVATVRGRKMTQKKALKLAIEALEYRRNKFAVGYHAYQDGTGGGWAERDFKKYVELCEAIRVLKGVFE